MSEFEYGFTDEHYDGSAYEEGRSDAIKEVLDIIDNADNDYEICALKFQKVKEAVKDLGGKAE